MTNKGAPEAQQLKNPSDPKRAGPLAGARKGTQHEITGLFAAIGGLERGLHRAGHRTVLLCENDPGAPAVLKARFPDVPHHNDVTKLHALPKATTLVVAGFPCQDLSQAGQTAGISGLRSGLVGEVFRLVRQAQTPW